MSSKNRNRSTREILRASFENTNRIHETHAARPFLAWKTKKFGTLNDGTTQLLHYGKALVDITLHENAVTNIYTLIIAKKNPLRHLRQAKTPREPTVPIKEMMELRRSLCMQLTTHEHIKTVNGKCFLAAFGANGFLHALETFQRKQAPLLRYRTVRQKEGYRSQNGLTWQTPGRWPRDGRSPEAQIRILCHVTRK